MQESEQESEIVKCLYCRKSFPVSQYGFEVPCPHCKRNLKIFPDPQMFLYTPMGTIGIAVVKNNGEAESYISKAGVAVKLFSGIRKLLS